MSKGSSSPQSTTSTTTPWEGQVPYLKELFANSQQLFREGGPDYFQGQQVASRDSATLEGQRLLTGAAGQVQPGVDASLNSMIFNMGAGRDVANNPYLKSAIQAAHQPVIESFNSVGGPMAQIRG